MGGRGCDSAEGRVKWEGGGVTPQRGGSRGREGGGVTPQRGGSSGREGV